MPTARIGDDAGWTDLGAQDGDDDEAFTLSTVTESALREEDDNVDDDTTATTILSSPTVLRPSAPQGRLAGRPAATVAVSMVAAAIRCTTKRALAAGRVKGRSLVVGACARAAVGHATSAVLGAGREQGGVWSALAIGSRPDAVLIAVSVCAATTILFWMVTRGGSQPP